MKFVRSKFIFFILIVVGFLTTKNVVFSGELERYLSDNFNGQDNTGCWCKSETPSATNWTKFSINSANSFVQFWQDSDFDQDVYAGIDYSLDEDWHDGILVLEDGTGCEHYQGNKITLRISPQHPEVKECKMIKYEGCLCKVSRDLEQLIERRDCRVAEDFGDLSSDQESGEDLIYVEEGTCKLGVEEIKLKQFCCCKETKNEAGIKTINCGSEQIKPVDDAVCAASEGGIKIPEELKAVGGTCGASYSEADLGKTEKVTIGLSMGNIKTSAQSLNYLNLDAGKSGVIGLVGRAIKLLLAFIGSISLALYVYAGILWMVSNGNSGQVDKAKNILLWTTLGIIVMLGSYVLVDFLFSKV